MKEFVFLTGMFRSGTTLLARMLNMHPQIACASDPYQPTLKEFRNAVADRLFGKENVDRTAPFDDYYFYEDKQALMKTVRETGLDLPVGDLFLPALREETARYAHDFSPQIEKHLDKLKGKTFADLVATGLEIIDLAYGDESTTMLGFKITWADEFARHLLDAFPAARVIHIVRDPRAVCASKFALEGRKYPLLFLTRQWRKLVTIAWMESRSGSLFRERTLVVKYEDLVTAPEQEAERMCDFLGLPFSPAVVDAASFKDGAGKTWEQNTSYADKTHAISSKSVDRWRQVFSKRQIEFIERLSFAEMLLYGYQPLAADSPRIPPDMVFEPPEAPLEQLAEWIIPYTRLEPHTLLHDMALETLRGATFTEDTPLTDKMKSALALDPDFFDELRTQCHGVAKELSQSY